jgi:hypothetical protein
MEPIVQLLPTMMARMCHDDNVALLSAETRRRKSPANGAKAPRKTPEIRAFRAIFGLR